MQAWIVRWWAISVIPLRSRWLIDPKPLYVAEISSFQLDDIKTFRPDVAILTNITEDHLGPV